MESTKLVKFLASSSRTAKNTKIRGNHPNVEFSAKIEYANGSIDSSLRNCDVLNLVKIINNQTSGEAIAKLTINLIEDKKNLLPMVYIAPKDELSEEHQQHKQSFAGFSSKEEMLGEIETRATEVAEKRINEIIEKERIKGIETENKKLKEENEELEEELEKINSEYQSFKSTYTQLKYFSGIASSLGATRLGEKLDGFALGFLPEEEQQAIQAQAEKDNAPSTDIEATEKDPQREIALESMYGFLKSLPNPKLADMLQLFKLLQLKEKNLKDAIYVLTEKQK